MGWSSVWVLDFVQDRVYNRSPGDLECMFIKARDSETRRAEHKKATGESLGSALLWFPRNFP